MSTMKPNTIETILLRLVICEPSALPTGCWEWPGHRCTGHYAVCSMKGKMVMIHRVVYEHFVASIPDDMELDHLCRNRVCANFEHLECVTREEHMRRGFQPYTPSPRRDPVWVKP